MATRYWIFREGEEEAMDQHFGREGAAQLAVKLLERETPADQHYEVHTAPTRSQ